MLPAGTVMVAPALFAKARMSISARLRLPLLTFMAHPPDMTAAYVNSFSPPKQVAKAAQFCRRWRRFGPMLPVTMAGVDEVIE
jgi:hypothetical protein